MIGDKLKTYRENHNLAEEDVAKLLNISKKNYQAYEKNILIPDAFTVKRLIDILSIPGDYLFDDIISVEDLLKSEKERVCKEINHLSIYEVQSVMSFIEFLKTQRGKN